jgi:hypothetical protein
MSAGRSNVLLGKKLKEKSPEVELLLTAHMPNYLAIVAPDPRLILSVSSLNSLVSSSIFSQPHVSIRGHHLTSPRCLYSRPGSNELLASELRDLAELRAA